MSNLDPSFTVGSQLTEPIRLKLGLSRNEARAKAMDLLARVGIPDPKRTFASYPHELSGGMAQRVLIAEARRLLRAEPDHRRRADHRARRHHPGGDPRPAA